MSFQYELIHHVRSAELERDVAEHNVTKPLRRRRSAQRRARLLELGAVIFAACSAAFGRLARSLHDRAHIRRAGAPS